MFHAGALIVFVFEYHNPHQVFLRALLVNVYSISDVQIERGKPSLTLGCVVKQLHVDFFAASFGTKKCFQWTAFMRSVLNIRWRLG